jgi:hypothetical protein
MRHSIITLHALLRKCMYNNLYSMCIVPVFVFIYLLHLVCTGCCTADFQQGLNVKHNIIITIIINTSYCQSNARLSEFARYTLMHARTHTHNVSAMPAVNTVMCVLAIV